VWRSDSVTTIHVERSRNPGLTPHELRIAVLVACGKTNCEIARDFAVTRRTVEYHLTNVDRKLCITRRGQLANVLCGMCILQL
jgi:DNA-binding NarL/FixJ family response regulator